jgi:hypothetical protein
VVELEGDSALRATGSIFAHRNFSGGTPEQGQATVKNLEQMNHGAGYLATAANLLGSRVTARAVEGERYALKHLPVEASPALEVAANEEIERQSLEGELRLLERAWREAQEIAAIADSLLLAPAFERFVAKPGKWGPPVDPPA